MRFKFGSYIGDGSTPRVISIGESWTPNLVIVKGGANTAVFVTTQMLSDAVNALQFADTNVASITALGAGSFTVNAAANVNASGTLYAWIAVNDDGAGDFFQGKYTGNNTDGRTVTGLGFAPNCVVSKRHNSTTVGVFRTSAHTGDDSSRWSSTANLAGAVKSLDADGFTLGTQVNVNANTSVYYFFAFKSVALKFAVGTYTGDGTDDRLITAGLFVRAAFVKNANVSAVDMRTSGFVDDSSAAVTAGAPRADAIQRFQQDGFQVGTLAAVNSNGVGMYWFALGYPSIVPIIDALIRQRSA